MSSKKEIAFHLYYICDVCVVFCWHIPCRKVWQFVFCRVCCIWDYRKSYFNLAVYISSPSFSFSLYLSSLFLPFPFSLFLPPSSHLSLSPSLSLSLSLSLPSSPSLSSRPSFSPFSLHLSELEEEIKREESGPNRHSMLFRVKKAQVSNVSKTKLHVQDGTNFPSRALISI